MLSPLIFFKCLAEDTRLKSLLLISLHKELCVCDLQSALQLSQPKVSRHLADLRKCNLLSDERRGKWVYYRLHPELPAWAQEVIATAARHNSEFLADCQQQLTACSSCES
ncbi:metalloregulator ArsR/SmtB family transcription factor [Bowmanella yangjiangensis]|uniref:Metalloregulator ArsR/SmtB family transcription factor n=1 Tax=Bowmanella yangjiangensis TaxID=2811230 RepID=A0ABS3CQC0_9ALTE|nr:metalloregulator ArsR/SmtB family transcription factor [Bowmanella yangjiangensis]MBN7818651.1 metalloregulator ArsR/SmtB family transcription factor [Bowmanella yangjiangensis]